MKIKLTKNFVDTVGLTDKGDVIYTDEMLTRLALRVGKRGKRYILNKRINGKLHRDLVEEAHLITLTVAREKASFMMRGR